MANHWPSDRVSMSAKTKQDSCLWVDDPEGYWSGSCGIKWEFEVGTPLENKMQFCLGCGNRLEQKGGAK